MENVEKLDELKHFLTCDQSKLMSMLIQKSSWSPCSTVYENWQPSSRLLRPTVAWHSSEHPDAICLNPGRRSLEPSFVRLLEPPFIQIFGRRLSKSPASIRPNIRLPFVRIFGLRSSESSAAVCPNLLPPFVQISGRRSSEAPASFHSNVQPPFVWISGLRSSKYTAAVCPNLRPSFIQISGLRLSKYSASIGYTNGLQQQPAMMKENGDVFVDFRNVLAAARGRQVWRKI